MPRIASHRRAELFHVAEGLEDEAVHAAGQEPRRLPREGGARPPPRDVSPKGSMRMPSGPMAPTTAARSPAASRASRAAASLIASVSAASPWCASLTGLAPKVLVSISSAPACT